MIGIKGERISKPIRKNAVEMAARVQPFNFAPGAN